MKKILPILGGIIFAIFVGVIGLHLYMFSQCDNFMLVSMSTDKESTRMPAAITDFYLFSFRGDKSDIEYMNHGGLGYLVDMLWDYPKEKDRYIDFFIERGLDVNGYDYGGLTAVHSFVLTNEVDKLKYVLSKGANPNLKTIHAIREGEKVKTKYTGLTPLEFGHFRDSNGSTRDRSEVYKILKEYKGNK